MRTYSYEGDGWGLTAGGGGSFEGHVEQSPGADRDEQQFYQAGLNLTFGNFAVGGAFEYYNNLVDVRSRATTSMPGSPAAALPTPWMPGPSARNTRTSWPKSTAAATTTSPWTARC